MSMLSLPTFSSTIDLGAKSTKKSVKVPPAEAAGTSSSSSINPIARTAVSLEYASLRHTEHCPLGIYVVPSQESLMMWDSVFFVHQGYYMDAVLRFRIEFPANYPETIPKVYFLSDVFHPLIAPEGGRFNLNPRFRPWRPKEHHVFDILHFVKSAFKKHALDAINSSDCLNHEAFSYHESTSSFAALTLQTAVLSQSNSALFDRDHPSMTRKSGEGIIFRQLRPEQLQEERKKLGLHAWEEQKS